MPYGAKVDHISQQMSYIYDGVTQFTDSFSSVPMADTWYRSGSNVNSGLIGPRANKVPGPPKWKIVSIRKGPKLPYKVWSKRLQKYVWARKPVECLRLVPTWTKAKVNRDKLKPNDFLFQNCQVNWQNRYGEYIESRDGISHTYRGDICNGFRTRWNNVPVGPDIGSLLNTANIPAEASALISDLSSDALASLYEKAKNQHFNMAQFLAERKQTLSMFAEGVSRIASALRSVRRGRIGTAMKQLFPGTTGQVANDWLMTQYGIKPLLSDLDGVARMLAEPEPYQYDIVSKRQKEFEVPTVHYTDYFHGLDTSLSISGKVIVKYKARVRVKGGITRNVYTRLGFGNPVALAWELIPYSFVVDWALPIGDYLNNQDAFAGFELEFVTKTVFIKWDIIFNRSASRPGFVGFEWSGPQCGFVAHQTYCSREVLPSLPALEFPEFKSPISTGHALNSLALLTQIFHRR